ncbi:MAG: hypothetical protein WAZ12_00340 [Candidatus Absconditicoccaceae bacterium]
MENYVETIQMTIKFSSKAIENLENHGIYEFQRNEMKSGIYEICICRSHQTDDILMFAQKEGINHLFTFVIPSEIREIKIGKTILSIRCL